MITINQSIDPDFYPESFIELANIYLKEIEIKLFVSIKGNNLKHTITIRNDKFEILNKDYLLKYIDKQIENAGWIVEHIENQFYVIYKISHPKAIFL